MQHQEPRTYTTKEVAALLGVSARLVGQMAARGELPAFKTGSKWKFPRGRLHREVLHEQEPS